jgi:hypothetical protein
MRRFPQEIFESFLIFLSYSLDPDCRLIFSGSRPDGVLFVRRFLVNNSYPLSSILMIFTEIVAIVIVTIAGELYLEWADPIDQI